MGSKLISKEIIQNQDYKLLEQKVEDIVAIIAQIRE
jgi:hypothetical protein